MAIPACGHAGNLSVGELETREATCEKLIQDLKIQVQTSTKISGEFLGTDVQLSYLCSMHQEGCSRHYEKPNKIRYNRSGDIQGIDMEYFISRSYRYFGPLHKQASARVAT